MSFPICMNCTRLKRECIRLAARLSWPKPKDGRRFITNHHVLPNQVLPEGGAIFVNMSQWDITLQVELEKNRLSLTHFNAWPNDVPGQLSPIPRIRTSEQMLLSYFTAMVPHLLAPFGDDSRISQFLLRIAFVDKTPASSAVLQGILALSSLRLYGAAEASLFRSKSISMLAASVKEGMHLTEHLRCLAASLLLGWYKISSSTDTGDGWAFFVCGAIKLAKAMSLPRILGSEEVLLLDWLSCHTILAQFSTSHWRQSETCVYRQPCAEDPQLQSVYSLIPDRSRIMSFLGCSLQFLDILSLTCSAMLPRSHPNFLSREHKQQLDSLELRLISTRGHSEIATATTRNQKRTDLVAELYRLAGLVYLHRGGRGSRVGFQPTENAIRDAFSIIKEIDDCESVWPLFIIGCEARSDEQRLLIHETFSRALERRGTDNMQSIRKMIEASWIQDDLCEDDETDYLMRINALMSANTVLPIFM